MKLTEQETRVIKNKTFGRCGICSHPGTQFHHIIFRNKTQGGTDHPDNLLLLCMVCHMEIHGGKRSEWFKELSYKYLPENLDNCWSGKLKSKVVNILES